MDDRQLEKMVYESFLSGVPHDVVQQKFELSDDKIKSILKGTYENDLYGEGISEYEYDFYKNHGPKVAIGLRCLYAYFRSVSKIAPACDVDRPRIRDLVRGDMLSFWPGPVFDNLSQGQGRNLHKLSESDIVRIAVERMVEHTPTTHLAERYPISHESVRRISDTGKRYNVDRPIKGVHYCPLKSHRKMTYLEIVSVRKQAKKYWTDIETFAGEYDLSSDEIKTVLKGERYEESGGPVAPEDFPEYWSRLYDYNKIPAEEIREARKRYPVDSNISAYTLANDWNLTRHKVRYILRGDRRREVGGPFLGEDYEMLRNGSISKEALQRAIEDLDEGVPIRKLQRRHRMTQRGITDLIDRHRS